MAELIRERFELWCRMLWVREIDRETKRIQKLRSELDRRRYILKKLLEKYKELYGEEEM